MQPAASPGAIVREARTRLHILKHKQVERVIVLLDLEDRDECPPSWVTTLEDEFQRGTGDLGIREINVVLKVRRYENWLIADTGGFRRLPRRFHLSRASVNAVSPDKADNVAALRILKQAARGLSYDKVSDAVKIMRVANARAAARNSRSLRRLLRLVGDPNYAAQSRRP